MVVVDVELCGVVLVGMAVVVVVLSWLFVVVQGGRDVGTVDLGL